MSDPITYLDRYYYNQEDINFDTIPIEVSTQKINQDTHSEHKFVISFAIKDLELGADFEYSIWKSENNLDTKLAGADGVTYDGPVNLYTEDRSTTNSVVLTAPSAHTVDYWFFSENLSNIQQKTGSYSNCKAQVNVFCVSQTP